jgi:muconolactone D-isomerase
LDFLVEITVELPAQMPEPERQRLREAELERGRELRAAGSIRAIWRLPGRYANVGVWSAGDASELHALIESLPLFPYLRVEVTALAAHPLSEEG